MVYILIKFQNDFKDNTVNYDLLARTVTRRSLLNRKKRYELRVEFEQLSNHLRESLIKYIFEEERKKRKIEKG